MTYIDLETKASIKDPALTATDHSSAPRGPQTPTMAPSNGRSYPALRAIAALVLREMSTKYGRTPGGYIWALLEPVGMIAAMAVLFSFLMRSPALGSSFLLFFASGFLPFIFYMNLLNAIQSAVTYSKPLLMYPTVSWMDAILARLFLNALTGILVMIIVFSIIVNVIDVTTVFHFGPMIEATLLAIALAFGLGVLNCFLIGMYPIWGKIWGIATRPKFILAGVFFLYEAMPSGLQDILWYTPWIHITGLFRAGVYPTYEPDWVSVPMLLAWSLIPLALGLVLLRWNYRDILLR